MRARRARPREVFDVAQGHLFIISRPCLVLGLLIGLIFLWTPPPAAAQTDEAAHYGAVIPTVAPRKPVVASVLPLYFDPAQGLSAEALIQRALTANGELAAARLELDKARVRLRQAGLRPNPTLEVEQTTGRLTGAAGERATSVGLNVPLEVSGQRQRRVELAQAELDATAALIADQERRVASEVRALYAEALAALRELSITEQLNELDTQTAAFVQIRVNEGDTAPLELNLLRVEVERLRARRALLEGRLQAALLQLRARAGLPFNEPLRLNEDLAAPVWTPPASVEAAVEIALRTRPDLQLARLTEQVAQAGFRLARAQARPEVTASARLSVGQTVFDDTPVGVLRDKDKLLTFGVTISLPVFNKNQGPQREAALAITQAQQRRVWLESVIRAEVQSAYARLEAARRAVRTFETGVINSSQENIRVIRAAYELGEFRISELLLEQRRLVDAQGEYTNALAEQYRARADLRAALGQP